MSELKTTPGPWKFRDSVDQHNDPCIAVYADGGVRIADLHADDGQELEAAKADAKLIAEAPELLRLLCGLKATLREILIANGMEDYFAAPTPWALISDADRLVNRLDGKE